MAQAKKTSKKLNTKVVVNKTTTIEVDKSMAKGTIDYVAANGGKSDVQPKPFLTKKKVIAASAFFILSIILIVLTLRFILKINWDTLFTSIQLGLQQKIGILWFSLFIVLAIINVFRGFITILPRVESLGCHISIWQWILYSITTQFLGAVTPSSIIIDPYTIFWMKTHGISTSKCASILFTNSLFWQANQIIINAVPLIMCCMNYRIMSATPARKAIFWLIIIGTGIDFITLFLCYFMCVSKRFHYAMSRIYNGFKKKLHLKYHTKAEVAKKYKKNEAIKQDFYAFMHDKKTTFLIIGLFALGEIIGAFTLVLGMAFVQHIQLGTVTVKVGFNVGWVFMCTRLSIPANRLNFLPGAALGYEWVLTELVTAFGGWKPIPQVPWWHPGWVNQARLDTTTNGILASRFFTGYIPAVIGLGGFVALTISQARLSKKGKLIQDKY